MLTPPRELPLLNKPQASSTLAASTQSLSTPPHHKRAFQQVAWFDLSAMSKTRNFSFTSCDFNVSVPAAPSEGTTKPRKNQTSSPGMNPLPLPHMFKHSAGGAIEFAWYKP